MLFGCFYILLIGAVAGAVVRVACGLTLESEAPWLHFWLSGAHNLPNEEAVRRQERREMVARLQRIRAREHRKW